MLSNNVIPEEGISRPTESLYLDFIDSSIYYDIEQPYRFYIEFLDRNSHLYKPQGEPPFLFAPKRVDVDGNFYTFTLPLFNHSYTVIRFSLPQELMEDKSARAVNEQSLIEIFEIIYNAQKY